MQCLIWVCVRSEVLCRVLWYLGSGSWVRPSGSLRSRRSEACNYWSPPGPLWGRSGSSDACCSCTDAQEFIFFKRGRACVCGTCVGMHGSARARVCQTDCRTIFSVNSLGQAVPLEIERGKVYMCIRPSHTVQRHTGLWRPPVLFRQQGGNKYEKHQLWPTIQLPFRWPQSIKFKLRVD